MSGNLFIVATPIGNLQDISDRALAILRTADLIACEDTRQTHKLLDAYGIRQSLLPLHQHNEHGASESLIARLQAGADVALVSDAGTPLISDPGQWLTQRALAEGIAVHPIPGASSVMAALSASGLSADQFIFAGFIPAKQGEREQFLQSYRYETRTTVFFETPHRIAQTFADMASIFAETREIVIARELTKQFEQIVRMPIAQAVSWLASDTNHGRGEFVLILAGADCAHDDRQWQAFADDLVEAGVSSKDASLLVAKYYAVKKKAVYQYILEKA